MNPITLASRFLYGTNDDNIQNELNDSIASIKEPFNGGTQSETLQRRDRDAAANIERLYRGNPDQLIAALKQQDPPLLGEAIKAGFNDVAQLLLKIIPSEIDAPDRFGQTPLILAIERKNETIVNALLAAGASVHATDATGCTALIWAAMTGIMDFVKSLLGASAIQSVDVQNRAGSTALMTAIRWGHLDIAAMLITDGKANVSLANHAGETALSLAIEKGAHELIDLLCATDADVNARTRAGDTMLTIAAARADHEAITSLIAYGADASALDKYGQTALMAALRRGDRGTVEHLIVYGRAAVTLANNEGYTPLHIAAKDGDDKLIYLLCQSGADVNAPDPKGFSPLTLAIRKKSVHAIDVLISNGANVNARDSEGRTALFHLISSKILFAEKQYEWAFNRLLKVGAKLSAMSEEVVEKLQHMGEFESMERERLLRTRTP